MGLVIANGNDIVFLANNSIFKNHLVVSSDSMNGSRGGARIFCLGGPNFVTNILVSSQDKPSHSGINAHTQI